MNPDKLLQPADVARMAGVTPKSVTRWAKKGWLPFLTTPGGHRRYRASDVMEMLQRGRPL